MRNGQCSRECGLRRADATFQILDAVDQVVRILALEPLIESKGLETGEGDDISVAHDLGGTALTVQQVRRDFDGPVMVEHHGRVRDVRSEEHTSELQSLMRISYAVFCLKKKKKK